MSLRNLLKTAIPIAIVIAFAGLGISQIKADRELKLENKIHLETTETKLRIKQDELRELNEQLDSEQADKDELLKEIERLEEEVALKKQREAQEAERIAEASRRASFTQTASASPAVQSYEPSGNKDTWLRASGIPESEWWAVDYIVSRESGWNPCAYNPGRSNCDLTHQQIDATWATRSGTACGLAQSLPCSKLGNNWNDPVYNLRWQYNYVKERYGGYPQAVAFWRVNHWY